MTAKRYLLAAAASLALSGCASFQSIHDVDAVRTAKAEGGTPFTRALVTEYQAQANEEVGEGEWNDAAWFALRGLQAAKGEIVLPADVTAVPPDASLRHGTLGPIVAIPADRVPELSAAHDRLFRFLDDGGRDRQPAIAAHAQALYDCWVEEEWEWEAPASITCRTDFLNTEKQFAMAPKPAAAAPMPTHFQVFFDWNRANISADAAKIILGAANEAKRRHVTHIDLIGHTDSSGSKAYNLKLSDRRADAVQGVLAADGVPAADISSKGVGEAGQLVPTADGVREPQNRRTEIILK